MSQIFALRASEPFDVVVVGGGLAGVCAALAAARSGAKTAIVQNRPVFGGNSSSEIRVPPIGAGMHNPYGVESGIIHEIVIEDRARNHDRVSTGLINSNWDMVLYDAVRAQAGLTHFLNTNVDEVIVADHRIAAVRGNQLGCEIRWEIPGAVFVDASGDGVVGFGAGAKWRIGQEAESEYNESFAPAEPWSHTLGSSLHFRARDIGRPAPFTPPAWAVRYDASDALPHHYHKQFDGGYWWIEIGWPYDTITQNETLRDELLRHVLGVWDHIKNHCPDTRDKACNWALDWIGMVPGKRESRRFVGAYVLNQNDLQQRRVFDDRVAYGGWLIDDHTKEGILDTSKEPSFNGVWHELFHVAIYSVPLRSLHVTEPENLFLAGRIVSVSRLAFNSLRVQQTMAVLGQAAGTAAAFCARERRVPTRLSATDLHAIQQQLLKADAYVPHVANEDPADLARQAKITATSQAPWACRPAVQGFDLKASAAQLVPIGSDGLDRVAIHVANAGTATATLRAALIEAQDIWDVAALQARDAAGATAATMTADISPGASDWVELACPAGLKPRQLYWLLLQPCPGVTWHYSDPTLPGLCAARQKNGHWWFAPDAYTEFRTLTLRPDPDPRAWAPDNVVSGVTRPEKWTNLWVSDPATGLPQDLNLEWTPPQGISCVHLTFDTNLCRTNFATPGLFHSPECVCDYTIETETAPGQWTPLANVTGNYQRQRTHSFTPVTTRHLRLRITATNGADSARVFEVRVY